MTEMTVLPKNAVFMKNDQPMTTTLVVADVFNKNHYDVLRVVKKLECSAEFSARNFAGATYLDAQGKLRSMFELTKDGFMFLAMGFTGKEAARWKEAFIRGFNEMAEALHQPQPLPPPAPKVELDEVEYLLMKTELLELKLEKAEKAKRTRSNPTRAQEEEIIRLSREGHGPTEIGLRVNRPKGGVVAIRKRLKKEGRL